MRLCRYLSKRFRDIGEFDTLNARIPQIPPDKTLSFGCPEPSSPCRQPTYQFVMVNENSVAPFGRP